jgi:hypothetical protein
VYYFYNHYYRIGSKKMSGRREMEGLEEVDDNVPELENQRYGGAQGDDDDEEAKRKMEERERKKAEVRKRLEEAGRAKKSQERFLDARTKEEAPQTFDAKSSRRFETTAVAKRTRTSTHLERTYNPVARC